MVEVLDFLEIQHTVTVVMDSLTLEVAEVVVDMKRLIVEVVLVDQE